MLESNTGYAQLHGMLVEAGDRALVRRPLWPADPATRAAPRGAWRAGA